MSNSLDPQIVDALGYLAAGVVFLTFCMKTMMTLRLVAITSNVAFIGYALAAGLTPILLLHGLLLPLNLFRLVQMLRLVRRSNEAAISDGDRFDWLIPLGERRALADGEMLFRKGDPAASLFVVAEGDLLLPEIGIKLGPGSMLGEMSLFMHDGRRTASAQAVGPVRLSEVTQRRVKELYFDNPGFAYALLRLITSRFVDNLHRLEKQAEERAAMVSTPAGDETKA